MGTIVLGKIECGTISKGQTMVLMPNKAYVEVIQIVCGGGDVEIEKAFCGDNVNIKLKNINVQDVSPGFVLCCTYSICHTAKLFDARIVMMECKSIVCAGYSAVLHIHNCVEDVCVNSILCIIDKKTNEKTRSKFINKEGQVAIVRFEIIDGIVCIETFEDFPYMGRFTLRDDCTTIAIGKVLKIIN
jgi:peptide chain release factor subunit 3